MAPNYVAYGWKSGANSISVSEAPIDSLSISGTLESVDANRGVALSDRLLATFHSGDATLTANDVAARVTWGDGVVEWGQVSTNGGSGGQSSGRSFQVKGTHTYHQSGKLAFQVDFFDIKGSVRPTQPASWPSANQIRSARTLTGTATVTGKDPVQVGSGPAITQSIGSAYGGGSPYGGMMGFGTENTQTLAVFHPDDPLAIAEYGATIYWGDGTTSDVSPTQRSDGDWDVKAGHSYGQAGHFRTLVVLKRTSGVPVAFSENEVIVTGTASLTPAAVTLTAEPIGHVSGDVIFEATTCGAKLGELIVTDDLWDARAARVNISWGDGGTSIGSLAPLPPLAGTSGRRYAVNGSHTYSQAGSYVVSLSVDRPCPEDVGQSALASARTSVTIMDPALGSGGGISLKTAAASYWGYSSYVGTAYETVSSGQDVFPWGSFASGLQNATVANFTSPNRDEKDFSATIQWGDGTFSDGVVFGRDGSFQVLASHSFGLEGTYRGTVTIVDTLTAVTIPITTTVTSTAVGLPNQIRGGRFFNRYQGSPATGRTIVWGDGTPSVDSPLNGSWGYNTTPFGSGGFFAPNGISESFGSPLGWNGFGATNLGYGASPYWGYSFDATLQSGAVAGVGSLWANHLYDVAGGYSVSSTLTDDTVSASASRAITVGDAPLSLVMVRPSWSATATGSDTAPTGSDRLLMVFSSTDKNESADSFEATLDPGDGSDSVTLRCARLANNSIGVYGDPAFANAGSYRMLISIARTKDDGAEPAALQTIIVASVKPSESPAGVSVTGSGVFEAGKPIGKAGSSATGVVLGVVSGLDGVVSDYSVTVQAPFSVTSPRLVQQAGTDKWTVMADATFGEQQWGNHDVTITLARVSNPYPAAMTAKMKMPVLSGWDAKLVTRSEDFERAGRLQVGNAEVSPSNGALRVTHDLDFDLSPGTSVGDDPQLVYNSATVAVRPVAEITLNRDLPVQITGAKVWVDGAASPVSVVLNGQPGIDGWTIRVPLNRVAATGNYFWNARLEISTADGGIIYQKLSGKQELVVRDNPGDPSPFGAGWGITGLDRLTEDGCHGLMWVTGAGDSKSFARNINLISMFPGGSTSYTSPPGDDGKLEKDAQGNYKYVARDKTETRFDAKGRITSVRDRRGLSRVYEYATDGRIKKITAPDGGETTFTFTDTTVSIKYPGRANPVTLDISGGVLNSIRDVDARQSVRTFGYSAGRMTLDSWSPYSTSIAYQGDTGRVFSITRGDSYWQINSAIDNPAPDGVVRGTPAAAVTEGIPGSTSLRKTEVRTDAQGRVLRETVFEQGTQKVLLSENRYVVNAAGDVTEARDSYDRPTKYEYGAIHEVIKVTHADGGVETFTYDPNFHVMKTRTDVRGNTTTYELNGLGDVQKITDPLGYQTTFAYVSATAGSANVGLIQTKTDARGVVETYAYDSHRRLSTTQQVIVQDLLLPATNGITTYMYDVAGNSSSVTDPLGRVSFTEYDARNQLTTRTDASGQMTGYLYFDSGLTQRVTDPPLTGSDPRRPITQYDYDVRGLLTSTTEGADAQIWRSSSRRYDSLGRLVEEKSGMGTGMLPELVSRVTHQYDTLDHETITTSGNGDVSTVSTSGYDALGNLLWETDANGVTTAYAYDAMDRLKRTREAVLPGTNAGWRFERYARQTVSGFDKAGNMVLQSAGDSNRLDIAAPKEVTTQWSYDSLNRQTSRIDALGTPIAVETITEYDSVGNVKSVTDNKAIGGDYTSATNARVTTSYEYDGLHHRTKIIEAAGSPEETVARLTYDQVGNLISETCGISEVNASVSHPTTTRYEYDGLNRRTRMTEAWSALDLAVNPLYGILSVGRVTTTLYDSQDRPISVTTGQTSSTGYRKPVTTLTQYDPLGNVVKVTEAAGDSGSERYTSYAYNTAGLVILQTTGQSAIAGYSKPTTTSFEYDSLGRKTWETEAPGTTLARRTSLTYDGEGRLLTKTEGLAGGPLFPVANAQPRIERHEYNELGQEKIVTLGYVGDDLRWRKTATTYDSAGNKLSVFAGNFSSVNDGTRFNHFNLTNYEYDAIGRMVVMTEAPGTDIQRATYQSYDSAGNLIQTTRGLGENPTYAQPLATQYLYDHLGHRKQMIEDAGSWSVVDNKWIWSPLPTSASLRRDTTWDYDAAGNVVKEVAGISAVTNYNRSQKTLFEYDTLNRLTGKIEAADTAVARKASYFYDAADNLIEQTTGLSGSALNPAGYARPITTRSAYDALGRVSAVIEAAGSESARKTTLTHDAADNEISRVTGESLSPTIPSNILRTETTYDLLNRPVQVTEAVGTPAMRFSTLDYDILDRIKIRSTGLTVNEDARPLSTRYQYNAFDQPTQMEEAVGTWAKNTLLVSGVPVYFWSWNPTATNPLNRKTTTNYDANGNVIEQETGKSAIPSYRRLGQTAMVYDALNRPVKTVEGALNVNDVNPGGDYRITLSGYDSADQVRLVTRYDGTRFNVPPPEATSEQWRFLRTEQTKYNFDRLGRKTEVIYGFVTDVQKATPSLIQGTFGDWYPDGVTSSVESFAYDASDNLIGTTNPRGVVSVQAYDALDRPTNSIAASAYLGITPGRGWASPTTQTIYDSQDRVVASIDPVGVATARVYDTLGRVITLVEGGTWNGAILMRPETRYGTFQYDAAGNMIYQKVGQGAENQNVAGLSTVYPYARPETTRFEYDVLGRKIKMTQAADVAEAATLGHASPVTGWKYDAAGNVVRITTPLTQTDFAYDDFSRSTEVREGSNDVTRQRVTTRAYDSANNVIETVDGNNVRHEMKYDILNRLLKTTDDPTGKAIQTTLTYDLFGIASKTTVADGTELYYHDRQGRLVWTKTTTSHWILNRYDLAGNRVRMEDWVKPYYYSTAPTPQQPNPPQVAGSWRKLITKYEYDPLGREIKSISPTLREVRTGYDAAGRYPFTTCSCALSTEMVISGPWMCQNQPRR